MPAYNEEANIEQTVKEWYPVIENIYITGGGNSKLVIVNDGSKDSTYEKAVALEKDYPLLKVLTKPNQGHGPTVIYAYQYAIDNGADYVFMTDSDGQTNPKEFDEFLKLSNDYDAVLGVRRVRGDGKARKFVEQVVCFLLLLYFHVKVQDANAPFRLIKASVLEKYLKRLPKDYNLPNIMLTAYMAFYKENIIFKEISFKPRTAGVNSINFKRIFKIGLKALSDFRTFKKDMKK